MLWAKICTSFRGLHHYDGATGSVSFLRNVHHHVFTVTFWAQQRHDDRDIEYLTAQGRLEILLTQCGVQPIDLGRQSCEMVAKGVVKWAIKTWGADRAYRCEVTEDGENGALYEWNISDPQP